MIREEIHKGLDRAVIRPSRPPWAAQCLRAKKKYDTLRLSIDWRALKNLLVSDRVGLGDLQPMFDGVKGKRYFTLLDLASRSHHIKIADRQEIALRSANGLRFEFTRAGVGMTVAAFTRRLKSAIVNLDEGQNWLHDMFVASAS